MSRSSVARKKSPVSAKRVSTRMASSGRTRQDSVLQRARASIQPVVSNSEEVLVQTAREHVQIAAQILKSLDPERARVAWLLEDAIVYLDDIEVDDIIEPYQPIQELVRKKSKK